MAAERTAIEEAWPGDVIGLFDPGQYRIGDTLVEGEPLPTSTACRASRPSTSPWSAAKDPLRRKQMEKGLEQLSEEGTIQIFQQLQMGMRDPIVGVVGALQFEVLQYRIEHEYGADILLDRLPVRPRPLGGGREVRPARPSTGKATARRSQDRDGLPLVLFRDDWALQHAEEKHPELKFLAAAPQLHEGKQATAAG